MTWHLKDKTLEQALCMTYAGFLEALNHAAELSVGCTNYVAVEFNKKLDNGDFHENHLVFQPDELEEVPEYNPKAWNNYPEVTPPYDVMMLIDLAKKSYGLVGFYRHSKEGDCWCFADGEIVPTCLSERIIRFRPKED